MSQVKFTNRWDTRTDAMVTEAARLCGGISKAQFIRESAVIRAILILEDGPVDPYADMARLRELSAQVRRDAASRRP